MYGKAEWLEWLRPQEGGSEAAETGTLDGPPGFQPLMRALGEESGAARASFSFYNTRADAGALTRAVAEVGEG